MNYDPTHYNAAPIGLKEVTEQEFVKGDFWIYNHTRQEFRQITRYPEGVEPIKDLLSIRLYWMPDGHGWGMINDYWKGKMRYFYFGCDHKWDNETRIGNCLHHYTCSVCKKTKEVDSSD